MTMVLAYSQSEVVLKYLSWTLLLGEVLAKVKIWKRNRLHMLFVDFIKESNKKTNKYITTINLIIYQDHNWDWINRTVA